LLKTNKAKSSATAWYFNRCLMALILIKTDVKIINFNSKMSSQLRLLPSRKFKILTLFLF
jgi:hypothetical protein